MTVVRSEESAAFDAQWTPQIAQRQLRVKRREASGPPAVRAQGTPTASMDRGRRRAGSFKDFMSFPASDLMQLRGECDGRPQVWW
jgi:hypothetical protein